MNKLESYRLAKTEDAAMERIRFGRIFAVVLSIMMTVPMVPAPAENPRAEDIIFHVSNFSDGKTEKTLSFNGPGTDKSMNIALPNGARVISATMNITGLPTADGGSDYPENVTIDVGNDGALEYEFRGKGYGQMGRQTLFSNGANYLNVSLPLNGGTNATPSVRLPMNATVTSAVMNINKPGRGKILLCIADSASIADNLKTILLTFPDVKQVDIVAAGTSTPTLATLKEYGSVLVASNNLFQDNKTLGDNLADYIDFGGGVVVALFAHSGQWTLSGRFVSGGYCAITSGVTYASGTSNMGTVYVPNHPLLNGVNSFTATYTVTQNFITPGAVRIADFANGYTMLATKNINGVDRADFGFPPNTNYWSPAADGKNLFHNALFYVGRLAINCSLDVGNDGSFEYRNLALNTSERIPDVAAQLNAYLASAQSNGMDAYGNEYVDVPIALSSNTSGALQLNNMSIIYQYKATMDPNPTNGNLAEGINLMIPRTYNMKSTNIPVAVFSNHAGKVKISNLHIDYIPPVHPAIIESRTPEDPVVLMDENTTMELCITASDPYGYPLNTTWTVNSRTVLKNSFNLSWYADFNANGTYNVTVSVDNGLQKVATSWMLIVRNVNRKPAIDSFGPDKKFEMDENSSATFEVSASDPDNDAIGYTWYADGKRVLTDETIYEFKTTYSSAGKHEVKVVVLDVLGGSTTFAWNITVKEVNAGPIIADSSPSGDEVTMSENSIKKFLVVDQSPDGDRQYIQWSLDGNNTGITGRSYNYSADFDSAGTHIIQAEVTDGKLSEKRIWTVTVQDVNRAPVAVIASPAAKAEFMLGTDIPLDGTTSSDPDGDTLSMTWSESGKALGTGGTLTVRLARGRHLITLGVDDGKKGGNATAQVEIFVRYIDFKGTVTVDIAAPTEGKKITLTAKLTNKGDGSVDELPVSFRVDGTEVSTTTIESIEPDSDFPLEFQWNAVKGDHKLEVSVNNQNFSKTVTVAKKPAAAAPVGGDMMPFLVIAIVVAVALVAGAAIYAGRKKRAAAQSAEEAEVPEEPGVPEEPEEAVPYKPIRKAPPAPAARPRPVPAPAAAPAPAPRAPSMTEEAKAKDTIDYVDRVLQDAENAGLDTAKARQSLKIARNFFEMGKYQKAMLYCKMAEDNLG
jgi:hypothetical protein